ncbi:MAG: helix-turn-helix transcriptional regulator [Acidobacteriota bacterium]|nr:MAG: helix-turn-helix transcriptional regulator [Acidobacteriota bacterium]
MEVLLLEPCSVGQLSERLFVEQSLLSHHLRVLREAGLVKGDRQGKSVIYRATESTLVPGKLNAINLGCCQLHFEPGQRQRFNSRTASQAEGGPE